MQCTQTRLNTNQWPIPHGWLFMTTMGSIHVVQKYANWHVWDLNNSNGTIYHDIKVGILDNTCFKENVPTFEILVGWILRLGLNFWVINVALYGWKCDPA